MFLARKQLFRFKSFEEMMKEGEEMDDNEFISDVHISFLSDSFDENEDKSPYNSGPFSYDSISTIPKFISSFNCPKKVRKLVDMTVEIETTVELLNITRKESTNEINTLEKELLCNSSGDSSRCDSVERIQKRKSMGFLVTPYTRNKTTILKFITCSHTFRVNENERMIDLKVIFEGRQFYGTIDYLPESVNTNQQQVNDDNYIVTEKSIERDVAIISVDLTEEKNLKIPRFFIENNCFIPSPVAAYTQFIDKKDNEKNDHEYQTPNEYNIYHIGKVYDNIYEDAEFMHLIDKKFPPARRITMNLSVYIPEIEKSISLGCLLKQQEQEINSSSTLKYLSGSTAYFSGGPVLTCSINIEKTRTIIERPYDELFRDEFSAILKRQGSYTFTNEVIGIHLHSVGDNNRTSTTTITNTNEGNYACSVFSWFEMYYQLVYLKHKDLFSEELQMKIEKEKIFYDSIMKSTFNGIDK
ncbi:hypothetical protein ABK040_014621 [Willaertia magna]